MSRRPPPSVIAANQPDRSGTFLKAWRAKQKMSQEKLGAAAGYTQGMISQWENGTAPLDLQNIDELADALGITRKQLMYRHPDTPETIEDIYDELPPSEQSHLIEIGRALKRSSQG